MIKKNREKQVRIYSIIAKNPGISLDKISEIIRMPVEEIQINLKFLLRHKIILCSDREGYKRYYLKKTNVGLRVEQSQEIRQKIYGFIEKSPGVYLSEIASEFQMRVSLAEYHLLHMEQNQKILAIKDDRGYYRRYFTKDSEIGFENKKLLSILRQEIPSKIISLLLKKSPMKHKEILEYFNVDKSTL
ncbi:MAG: hypothetical protein DRN27_10360, partial [Thermoplasmata archaeon]